MDPGIKIDFSNSYTDSDYLNLDGGPYQGSGIYSPNEVFQNFHASNKYVWGGDINWSIT